MSEASSCCRGRHPEWTPVSHCPRWGDGFTPPLFLRLIPQRMCAQLQAEPPQWPSLRFWKQWVSRLRTDGRHGTGQRGRLLAHTVGTAVLTEKRGSFQRTAHGLKSTFPHRSRPSAAIWAFLSRPALPFRCGHNSSSRPPHLLTRCVLCDPFRPRPPQLRTVMEPRKLMSFLPLTIYPVLGTTCYHGKAGFALLRSQDPVKLLQMRKEGRLGKNCAPRRLL